MSNYPDDCQGNDPHLPWNEPEQEDPSTDFQKALYEVDGDAYFGMFDSQQSDDLVLLLREFHGDPNKVNISKLIVQLDSMLLAHLEN